MRAGYQQKTLGPLPPLAAALALAAPLAAAAEFLELELGGYVKVDAHYSDVANRAANDRLDAFMIPALIPLDGEEDASDVLRFSARETRINLRGSADTERGPLIAFVEFDFLEDAAHERNRLLGNQLPRLRHAYGELGPWLLGQTWSTFYNVATKPETLDFVGPAGTVIRRNLQLRYTVPVAAGNLLMALEQPFTTLLLEGDFAEAEPGAPLLDGRDDRFPDLVARYELQTAGGAEGSLAVSARNLRAAESASQVLGEAVDDDRWGGAVSLTGTVPVLGVHDVRFQLNYGDALGRYIALNAFADGFLDDQGSIDSLEIWGGYLAYRHAWSETTRSNLVYGYAQADNPTGAPETSNRRVQSVHVNLLHTVVPAVDIGIEYLWAQRQVEDRREGELNRLLVSGRFSF